MLFLHQVGVVILCAVADTLLECLIQLAPCNVCRDRAAGFPEILLYLCRLRTDRQSFQVIQ
jgi:hypothetical protein